MPTTPYIRKTKGIKWTSYKDGLVLTGAFKFATEYFDNSVDLEGIAFRVCLPC
jgi:hypothetical protein